MFLLVERLHSNRYIWSKQVLYFYISGFDDRTLAIPTQSTYTEIAFWNTLIQQFDYVITLTRYYVGNKTTQAVVWSLHIKEISVSFSRL